ncbi:MAG: GldG family protein, partial [Thermoanaerobaculia bacterium]
MADDASRPAEDREPTTPREDEPGSAAAQEPAEERTREPRSGRESGRGSGGTAGASVLKGSLLGAGVLLVAALLVIVNYLGWKYHWRFDWTETNIYSLSETTENVLRDLEEDVQVTVFLTPGSRLYEPTRELLARYEAESPRVSVRWLDPERNPAEAERLIEQYDVSAASVVFEAGDERRVVAADDLAELDASGAQMGQQPEISAFEGEERFTSALVDLTQGGKPRVLFTTGHGELALDDPSGAGLGTAREILGPENVEIDEWSSLGADAVPEGTDLVVIAGPEAGFTEDELSVLGTYLAGGGRLLVFLDPVFQPGGAGAGMAELGLQEWLGGYGVAVENHLVVDPTTTPMGFSAETFFATRYQPHPVTQSLADGSIPVLVRHSRPVTSASAPEGATVTELFETSADGWAVTSFDRESYAEPAEEDVRGPVALAVTVEAEVRPQDEAAPEEATADPE